MTVSFGPSGEIHGDHVALVSAAARTAPGTGPIMVAGAHDTARLEIVVTALSGTAPGVIATLEHSADGTTWRAHSAFAEVTTVSTVRKIFAGIDQFVRISWTISGSGTSVTFSLSGYLV